jgi:uncharacterized protein YfaS (alpha-2-macroglobulin family)
MRVFATVVSVTLTLAATAPARVVSFGGEPLAALPEYDITAGATEEQVLADVRSYFDEQSYAWALAAANALAERWPDSQSRAENDYYRLRCLMQLSRFAELDEAFDEYFRRYKDGPRAAEAVDFLLDVYTDCEYVLEDYTRREIAYAWDDYLEETHGYEFRYGTEGSAKLDEKRWEILNLNDEIYKRLISRERDAAARLLLADRRVLNYVKASTFLDWEQYRDDEQKYYGERKKYNERVAAFEMSDDMRSMLAFLGGLLELFALPAPSGGPDKSRMSWRDYDAWLNAQRLEAARATWEEVAVEYGGAPGGLTARAALAHYDVVYFNEPEKAVALFEEVDELAETEAAAELVANVKRSLSAPALAITDVKADAAGTPAVAVTVACRGIPEVQVSLYEIDPARYPAFYDEFANAGLDAGALPGVTREVETRTIPGSAPGGLYRIDEATAEWDELPAGLYVVECLGAGERSRAIFLLSGALLITANDDYDLYVEAVDAVTGEAVAVENLRTWLVRYRQNDFREITSMEAVELPSRPAAEGAAMDLKPLPDMSSVYLVAETRLGPAVHAVGTAYAMRDNEPKTVEGAVITDRPLYEPGDAVRFKTIFREVDFVDKAMAAAASRNVEVGLYSDYYGTGEPIWTGTGVTDEYGTYAGEFVLPAQTGLGGFTLRAKVSEKGRDYYARANVNVAEFEKPEYSFSVKADKDRYVAGERAEVEVIAAYYFGEPMAGAPLTYAVSFYPLGGYGGEPKILIKEKRGFLDDDGRYVIAFDTPGARRLDSQVSVEVKVGDETARVLEYTEQFLVDKTDRYVVLDADVTRCEPGEDVRFKVQIYELGGRKVSGVVELAAYEEVRLPEGGFGRGALLAQGEVPVGAETDAYYTLKLQNPPSHVVVVAKTRGSNGIWEETGKPIIFEYEPDEELRREAMVRVGAEPAEAAVGEEVEVEVLSRVDAASCLVLTYTDKGTLSPRTVALSPADDGYRGSFRVLVGPRHFPRITIYAVVVKDGESYNGRWASTSVKVINPVTGMEVDAAAASDNYRPGEEAAVRVACRTDGGAPLPADMSVAVVDEALLALFSDESAEVPAFFEGAFERPAGCDIKTSARARGEVAKIVYRFPGYAWPFGVLGSDFLPVDVDRWGPAARLIERVFLNDVHSASLETYLDLSKQMEAFGREEDWFGDYRDVAWRLERGRFLSPYKTGREPGVAGLGGIPVHLVSYGAGGGAGTGGRLTVRKEFADTAFWLPNLRTDESGVASASFTLPDNVTTWRVMALAMDKGPRFGWASDTFEVSKDVVARLKAPRYFVAGDVARLAAIGHNYLPEPQELTLAWEEEGLTHVRGEATATRTVDAGGRDAMYHWVEAAPVNEARIVTSVRCEAGGDAAEYSFPVYPCGSKVRQAYAGRLGDEVAHTLTVAEGAVPSSFGGELILAPSLAATLSHGLGFFRDYPYDCVEQTLNRFRVNAELAAAAAELELEKTSLTEGLPEAIERGLDKLKEQQTGGRGSYSGGWPWTTGGPESPYFTAYVVDGLYDSLDSPYLTAQAERVASNLLRTGKGAIEEYWQKLRNDPAFEPGETSLYVADVALRTGAVSPDEFTVGKIADYYFETRPAQEAMALALLASVLYQMGDDERLAVVMRNLDNGAQVGPEETIYWGKAPAETWRWWDDAVETTAKVLEVKLAYQPDDPNVPKMVDWLVDRRRGAAWKSTKDSAAATLALMKYIRANPELAAPIVASYKFGTREGGIEVDPTAYEEPTEAVTFAWEDVAAGDNDVEITRTAGDGPAFYTAAVEYYVDADEIPAVRGSVTLEREYYVVEREVKKGKVTEKKRRLAGPVKLGDDVEVLLKINSPYDFDYVVLEDPKPAGLIYLEDKSGYSWAAGAYVELWNRQRSALFERLPRGETVMRYRLRAEVPGTYAALPARVYGMYSPDIGSSTASAVVEVGE